MNIGDKLQHIHIPSISIEVLDVTNRGYKVRETDAKGLTKKSRQGKIAYYYKSDMTQFKKIG